MEGALRLLLLLALLLDGARAAHAVAGAAVLVAGTNAASSAGTITGTGTNYGDDYNSKVPAVVVKPNLAATEVVLFCRRDLRPGAPCCDAVVSYVDAAGICRVSTEPQFILASLNASRILALYAASGGRHLVVAAACQGKDLFGFVCLIVRFVFLFQIVFASWIRQEQGSSC